MGKKPGGHFLRRQSERRQSYHTYYQTSRHFVDPASRPSEQQALAKAAKGKK